MNQFMTQDNDQRNNKDNDRRKEDWWEWMKCHQNKDVYYSFMALLGQIEGIDIFNALRSF